MNILKNILQNKTVRTFCDLDHKITYHDIIEIEVAIMVFMMWNKIY